MDRRSAHELELMQRVARLEAEMVQMRDFVNAVRSSMSLPPLQPPSFPVVTSHSSAPAPRSSSTHRPSLHPVPTDKQRIFFERNNVTHDQLAAFVQWLDVPADRVAASMAEASYVVSLVLSPGGRADLPRDHFMQPAIVHKYSYLVVLRVGMDPVYLPATTIPLDRQFSIPLDDDFIGPREFVSDALRARRMLQDALFLQNHVKGRVAPLEAVGASVPVECFTCPSQAIYQCGGCKELKYCWSHREQHAEHGHECLAPALGK